MFDYNTIKDQVIDYTGEWADTYDLDAVMDELRGMTIIDGDYEGDVRSIDDVDIDDVLQRHDVSDCDHRYVVRYWVGDDHDEVEFESDANDDELESDARAAITSRKGRSIGARAEIDSIDRA